MMPTSFGEDQKEPPWYSQAAASISTHMYLKSIGTMAFIGLFFGAYFYVLINPVYPTTVMPITALDRLITFQPDTLPLYLSLWLYVSIPPALLATRRELVDYGLTMAATCIIGLLIFFFWPTTIPTVTIDWAQYPDVNFLKGLDAAGNACPSLHVTTAIFSGIWIHYLLRRFGAPLAVIVFNWVWCIGIIYSTLAIHQHVVLDVVAGLALGGLMAYLSLQHNKKAAFAIGKV